MVSVKLLVSYGLSMKLEFL